MVPCQYDCDAQKCSLCIGLYWFGISIKFGNIWLLILAQKLSTNHICFKLDKSLYESHIHGISNINQNVYCATGTYMSHLSGL